MTIPVPTCIRGTKNYLVKYTSGLPMGTIKEREEGTTCMQYTAPLGMLSAFRIETC